MLETLMVKTQSGTCPIVIGEGVVTRNGLDMPESLASVQRWVMITDEQVASHYPDVIDDLLADREAVLILPSGEASKNLQRVEWVLENLADRGMNREDGLMALGGGVIGDLTGFCASVYMRGIKWIQIPTTLLAQVDSSVGGKTGVNLKQGKNLAGTFHQPGAVWVDPLFLNTLPDREFWGGCSEVVKYAIIQGDDFLQWLEGQWGHLESKNPEVLAALIGKCLNSKKEIVEMDEREAGLRKVLNVGHTACHAIEKLMNHRVTHGEALRQGLLFELALAHRLQWITERKLDRIKSLVERIPITTNIPEYPLKDMVPFMLLDKKNRNQTISFVLPHHSGKIKEAMMTGEALIELMGK